MKEEIRNYIDNYISEFSPYKSGRWCYEDGIIITAIYDMYLTTNDKKYFDFVYNYYDNAICDDGVIKNYSLDEFNIDNICAGNTLIDIYLQTKENKFKVAIDTLRNQLKLHPRTSEGSFWHKNIYPYQVWMDGIYMGLVFYTKYAKYFGNNEDILDVEKELKLLVKRLYDEERKLFVHAYDELKVMQWADPVTGKSPNVWARACGWVAMAVVDIYEIAHLDICVDILNKLYNGLLPYLDEGMLYQIVDKKEYNPQDSQGNYLETSGSAMLSYALLKGTKLKMIDAYQDGLRIFNTIVDKKFKDGHLLDICKVGGLDNKRRDGSLAYYMSEPIVSDEVKGVAPFIMAASILED